MPERFTWSVRRVAWTSAGAIALGVGAIGAVLPVLPTTPFVILAVFAFGKGSPALARRPEESRVFGQVIAGWRQSGAITPRVKVLALGMMIAAFALSMVLGAGLLVLATQGAAICAAAIFILTRPSRAR